MTKAASKSQLAGRARRAVACWIVVAVASAFGLGCSSPRHESPGVQTLKQERIVTRDVGEQMRSDVMGFADTHASRIAQVCDELLAQEPLPPTAVCNFAILTKIGTTTSSLTIATAPNPYIALLDMVVMVTLKRQSLEEHTVPNVLHERGQRVLVAWQRSETEVWALAGKYLTPAQIGELRVLIGQWRAENKGMTYVGFVRLSDFGAYRQHVESGQRAAAGSVFSLFYVDPLAKLDPVADEIRAYRSLTERLAFLGARMPVMLTMNTQLAVWQATNDPGVQRFISSTELFAASTDRFARAVEKYPADLARERDAAIRQADAAMTAQRQELVKEIERQEGRIHAVLADARGVVDAAERTAGTAKSAAAETVDATERATRRTLDHTFWLCLALLLCGLAGVPLSVLVYRAFARRMSAHRTIATGSG